MLRRFLENSEGSNIYAIIGMIIFILSFAGIVIWIFRVKKSYITKMKNLPLEDDKNSTGDNNEIK